jgi:hypothetical protein
MDGRVLVDVFTQDFLKNRSPKYTSLKKVVPVNSDQMEYTETEAQKIEERLKGLGYL